MKCRDPKHACPICKGQGSTWEPVFSYFMGVTPMKSKMPFICKKCHGNGTYFGHRTAAKGTK